MPQDDPFLGMARYYSSQSFGNNMWIPGAPPLIQELQQRADDLLFRLSIILDPAKRRPLSDELQVLTMENYWRIPVYWEQEAVAFWPEVRGYVHQPSGTHLKMEHLWIDPAHKSDRGFRGQTLGVPGGM